MTDEAVAGDEHEDFASFYREVVDSLRGYVFSLSPTLDADAVANEALTRTFTHWGSISGSKRAWAFRVAHNLVRTMHRGKPAIPMPPDELPGGQGGRFAGPELSYELLELFQAIATLPPSERVPILLAAQELSPREIAEVLDMKPRTVSKYLYRARQRLARLGLADRRPPVTAGSASQQDSADQSDQSDQSDQDVLDADSPGAEHTRPQGMRHA